MTANRRHSVMPVIGQKKLHSVKEAAEMLSITRKHLYTLIGRGEISTVTIGRRRLIPAAELDRFVEDLIRSAG